MKTILFNVAIVKIRMAFDDLVIPPLREFDDFFPGSLIEYTVYYTYMLHANR